METLKTREYVGKGYIWTSMVYYIQYNGNGLCHCLMVTIMFVSNPVI